MLRQVLPLTLGAAGTRAWDLPLGGAGERESRRLRAASPERAAGGPEGKSGEGKREGEGEGEVTESSTWRIVCGLQPLCFYL